ncbi:MAG: hypothetical protein QNJ14_13540 [Woeseiaceae bacterium]|nr:hypothetical protein [Woeseiaceae bacterium]
MSTTATPEITLEQFERGDVDPALFDHEAHVYAGWLYVVRFGRQEAITRFDAALKRLVTKLGAESKYNAMITWLFLVLIADRVRDDEDWPAFRSRNADLIEDRPKAA